LNGGCRAILALDADGQHDPGDIPKFLQAHEQNADAILIGSRMAQAECFPRQRYYSNRVAAFFISQALGQYLEDTQCGFRLYPAKVIDSINLTTCHFQTETEVLLRAAPGRTTWWSLSATGKSPYVLTPEGRRPPNSPKRKFFGLESGEDSIYVCQFQKNFQ
jgi:hypothetical protein